MTDNSGELSVFKRRVEERRRQREQQLAQLREQIQEKKESASKKGDVDLSDVAKGNDDFADLIPTDDDDPVKQQDKLIDEALSKIDILTAYRKWCNKSQPKVRSGQTESIMVSCPQPNHPDKHPSAWINTDKQTFYCAACDIGGDKYDIAAIHFSISDYKNGANFHRLRKEMLQSFGYSFLKAPGIDREFLVEPQLVSKPVTAIPEPKIEEEDTSADSTDDDTAGPATTGGDNDSSNRSKADSKSASNNVFSLITGGNEDDDGFDIDKVSLGNLNWRQVVPEDTFLDTYLKACCVDDVPEEYHFWNGMLALGFALGRDTKLYDRVPVYGNLFICIIGPTGSGKSQSRYHLDRLLNAALPHDWNDPFSKGVRKVSVPASAEALIYSFYKPVMDPSQPTKVSFLAPVRGMVDFNELSQLVGRTSRQGNVLKPTLMQFYDMEETVSTVSRTHGVNEAYQPFASVLTTTQPKSLKNLLSMDDTSSGFLNRWFFAGGTYKQRMAIGGTMVDIQPAVDPLKGILGWSAMNKELGWSDEAATEFTKYFRQVLEPVKLKDESGLLARIDLTMKKVILLLTANSKLSEVSLDIVNKAKVVVEYILNCYGVPAQLIGNTLSMEIHDELARHIQRINEKNGDKGVSLNELRKRIARKKFPLEQVHKMLKLMTEMGEVEVLPPVKGPGRPSIKYKYVG